MDTAAGPPVPARQPEEDPRFATSFLVRSRHDHWIWEVVSAEEAHDLRAPGTPMVVQAHHEGREAWEVLRGELGVRDLEEWAETCAELVRERKSFEDVMRSEMWRRQRRARGRS